MGDKVLLLDRGKGKLKNRFKGPYIVREFSEVNSTVKLNQLDGKPLSSYNYKVAHLKLYKERELIFLFYVITLSDKKNDLTHLSPFPNLHSV